MKSVSNSRYLRKNLTEAESLLWSILRKKQVLGIKFRRQHPIGEYILDFYCPEIKMAVEADGSSHQYRSRKLKDKKRDEYLKSVGVDVVRFKNTNIIKNLDEVMDTLIAYVLKKKVSPSYLPLL